MSKIEYLRSEIKKTGYRARVSVLIVKYFADKSARVCLQSILGLQDLISEVVVVDNSPSENPEFSGRTGNNIKYVKTTQNLGYPGGCNEGAKVTKGELILFLNQDTRINGKSLQKLVKGILQDPEIAAIQPLLRESPNSINVGGTITPYGVGLPENLSQIHGGLLNVFYTSGAILLVRRKIFDELGGFDDSYLSNIFNDVDFCWRARLYGYKVACDVLAVGYHSSHEAKPILRFYFCKMNRIATLLKNYSILNVIKYIPLTLDVSFGKAILHAKDHPRNSMLLLSACLNCLVTLPNIIRRRSLVQTRRKINDNEVLRMMPMLNPFVIFKSTRKVWT
jgi:GT2 family glycosyltransferase